MKTIEEKAKAYDEAIQKLRGMMPNWERLSYNGKIFLQDLIHIFPELKVSEDERIRKIITLCLEECVHSDIIRDYEKDNAIAWLEKQCTKTMDCSQNHQDSNHPNGCIVLEDFNGGEGFYKVHLDYLSKKQIEEVEEMVRVWNHEESNTSNENVNIQQKDFEKKELKKIKQNPAWSEEDEKMFKETLAFIETVEDINNAKDGFLDVKMWLKSLKDRVQPQPKQELSKEDENAIDVIKNVIKDSDKINSQIYTDGVKDALLKWLESLKGRYTWKPSDKQMDALDSTLQYSQVSHNSFEQLNSLFNDLKKLREE